METNKVPTSTSTTVSATSATINPLFDPVALQTAYLAAAQLHTQLQHLPNTTVAATTALSTDSNVHTSQKPTTPLSLPGFPSFVDNDRFYSLLPAHLQSSLKQQQRNFLQQQSLAHPFSAFSPINTDLPNPNSATATASSLLAQSPPTVPAVPPMPSAQHSLDLLLMQMQMATAAAAAAAGFFPGAFNVLPPVTAAAALGLLAPQFRLLQLGDPNFPPYAAASADTSATTNGLFAGDVSNKGVGDASAIERSLLQAQINLLTNGSSSSTSFNERACTSSTASDTSPNDVTSSLLQQLSPALNNSFSSQNGNSTMKQQRIQMKRPYDEMSILRSLCSENCTTEQETEMMYGKRSRIGTADEGGLRSLQKAVKRKSQQQQFSLQPDSKDLAEELTGNSKTDKRNAEKCTTFCPFDENSPDRHHPLNHRPPAMEARFLECMAAIALHSNIPLPIKDESVIHSTNGDEIKPEENDISDKSSTKEFITDIESENSSNAELRSIQSPDRSKSKENTSTTITTNENGSKKCWPNSAIDEELCKELENYKDSDVPVIHAFVLPSKLSDPASSPVLNEKCSEDSPCTVVPESVAVPVPVLNILLDRILQTMLDP
uniref:Uncharacterized protein n=1 Tax=Setaria digitata TaxID=48799 RepID=A0A915PG33_9BILA